MKSGDEDTKACARKISAQSKMQSEIMPVGVLGFNLAQESRDLPASEPPPLPVNPELRYIGKSIERWDGRLKVTGRAKYTADIQLASMQYAKLANASVPHAGIRSMDVSAAQGLSGVTSNHRIHAENLLDVAVLRPLPDEAPSEWPVVRYAGQPIVSVAAISPAIAGDAAKLVSVNYAPLPFVVDAKVARQQNAPHVFPGPVDPSAFSWEEDQQVQISQIGNVRGPSIHTRGDLEKGFRDADVVIEGRYFTPVQTDSPLETHSVIVDWRPEMMTIWVSTMDIARVREEFSAFFHLPMSQVQVIGEFVGCGHESTSGAGNADMCAAAVSKKSKAPVCLVLDRKEEHLSGGNRPDSDQTLRIGAKADGSLTAIELVSYGTAGCGTGAGCAGPVFHMYKSSTLRTLENDVFTNAGPALSTQPGGYIQGTFALEQAIDELADTLKIDPLDMRDRIDENPVRRIGRQIARESDIWRSRNQPHFRPQHPILYGVGFAQSVWPRNIELNSAAEVRIYKDGSVEVLSAAQDTGGGLKTALAQIVAEEFGIPPNQIGVRIGDTNHPSGPGSGRGSVIVSLSPATRDAAFHAKLRFLANIAPACGAAVEDLELVNGEVRSKSGNMKPIELSSAARLLSSEISARGERIPDYDPARAESYGGINVAEISVDAETGRIRVQRVLAVYDCGRPINPTQIVTSIQGGLVQGISATLFEQRWLDPNTGCMVNANLDQYKIAGSQEIPEIHVELLESYAGQSSADASGIGGGAITAIGAAIANAFYNATGKRIRRTPMILSTVLAVLGTASQKDIQA